MSNEIIIKGLSRLAYQFKDSEKFKDFLIAFLDEFQYLQEQNINLKTLRTLDDSQGIQLDGIGEIAVLPRPEESVEALGAFGFEGDDTAKGFADLFNLSLGGNFVGLDVVTQPVGDDLYRLAIRAKIIQNKTTMTVDETTELISFTLGGNSVRYFLTENLNPRYDIKGYIDQFEQNIINSIPLLIGLGTVTYIMYSDTNPFVFAEDSDPNGNGFGDIGDINLGGNFASIF